jgi:excisionase family DNA binding protein
MHDIQIKTLKETQARNYTVKEACAALNISHAHFYKMVKAGRVNPIKLGRKTLVPIWQIDQIIGA